MKLDTLLDFLPGKGRLMEVLAAVGLGFALCLGVLLWMERRENNQLRDLNRGLIEDVRTANDSVEALKAEIKKKNDVARLTRAIAQARQQDIVRLRAQIEVVSSERKRLADRLRDLKGDSEPVSEEVWREL